MVFTGVYLCLLVFYIYWCLSVFTSVYLCLLVYTGVYLCILVFTCVYWSLTSVYWFSCAHVGMLPMVCLPYSVVNTNRDTKKLILS